MLLHVCFALRFCERGGLRTIDGFYHGIDGLPLCLCAFLCAGNTNCRYTKQ